MWKYMWWYNIFNINRELNTFNDNKRGDRDEYRIGSK